MGEFKWVTNYNSRNPQELTGLHWALDYTPLHLGEQSLETGATELPEEMKTHLLHSGIWPDWEKNNKKKIEETANWYVFQKYKLEIENSFLSQKLPF